MAARRGRAEPNLNERRFVVLLAGNPRRVLCGWRLATRPWVSVRGLVDEGLLRFVAMFHVKPRCRSALPGMRVRFLSPGGPESGRGRCSTGAALVLFGCPDLRLAPRTGGGRRKAT